MNARIASVVLVCLMLCMGGCDAQFAKGSGSLYEKHVYLLRAPLTHRATVNPPLSPDIGPANGTSMHPTINPNIGRRLDLFGPGPATAIPAASQSGMLDAIDPRYLIPMGLMGFGVLIGSKRAKVRARD